jgi:type I restriction enzyme S subunit
MDNLMMEEKILKLDKNNWKLIKLGELATEISKRVDNPSKSKYDRFVGLGNFVSGDIKIKSWETTQNLASSAKAFEVGDILFARRNAYLRRASIVDFEGCCSGDAFVLRENHNKVVPGFLAFLLNSDALWDYANSNAAGTMSKRVKWRDLAEYEFLLPPKDQQVKIAELLWTMDEVIERENLLNQNLKLLKQSQLKEVFDKGNCDKFKIGDITDNLDNKRKPVARNKRIKGETPYYGASGIVDYVDGYTHNEPILLISEDGENLNSRNLPIAYSVDGESWINNHVHALRVTKFSRYLVKEYFNFSDISDFITGGTRPKVTKAMLTDMPIYLPKKEAKADCENKLLEIDTSLENNKSKLDSSKALQKSLINQVFSK